MDIFEKAFARLWSLNKRRSARKRASESSSTVYLENIQKSLEYFAGTLMPDCFPLQVSPCLHASNSGFVGLKDNILFLPTEVNWFGEPEKNRKVYLNIILQIAGAHQLRIKDSRGDLNPWQSRIEFLKKISRVNQQIDSDFAGYRDFQQELLHNLISQTNQRNTNQRNANQSNTNQRKLKQTIKPDLNLDLWIEAILSRTELESQVVQSEPAQRKWSQKFAFLWLTVPCLEVQAESSLDKSLMAGSGKASSKEAPKTELAKPKTGAVEVVDLDKETGNPVTHSFEKTQTADEYQGGYKLDSGDDELQQHSQALQELDLSKVTRGGESALSIYRGESVEPFGSQVQEPLQTVSTAFLYPEWNFKRSSYQGKHCQLFENPLPITLNSNLNSNSISNSNSNSKLIEALDPAEHYRKKLETQHISQIGPWRRKIQGLLNEPLWCGRLREGDEIDWDSYVREFPAILQRRDLEGRWYSRKLERVQEISVLILFDQSLSTDSWVKNRRVLDVILDSIGLAGILFEDVISEVQVAGTWSATRHECGFQFYKSVAQGWNSFFAAAPQIEPRGYTRLGPALRHGAEVLAQSKAHKRLLLLLTDGKPTDLDGYEGRYGIYDVKQACLEAEARGLLPFALTIDQESKQHFPKMFNHYKLLQNPENLSEELYQILLRLIRRTR